MQSETEGPPPTPRVWEGWPTIGFGLAILAVFIAAQSFVFAFFILGKYIDNPQVDILQLVSSLSTDGLVISIATIISATFGVGFIIVFVKLRKGASIKEYLELSPISKKTILIILAVLIGLIAISSVLNSFYPQSKNETFTLDIYKTSVWPVLLGIALVIFTPAFEEGFFRGFVFVGLKQSRLGPYGTIGLTALAFASLHLQYDIFGMLSVFVLGLVFGTVRLKTGSLWSTILLHAVWNLFGIIGAALFVNGIGT